MKQRKTYKMITALILCITMVLMSNMSAFALSTGSYGTNKTYSTTTYFTKDGSNYECPQTKYSYKASYNTVNGTYYILDSCSLTQKSTGATARNFGVRATTTKRSSSSTIYSSNPFATASSSILYSGSGSITCKVTASSGFPLGTTSNTVTGTNTYCEVYEAFNYDAKCSLAGTVTCSKANCSGTAYVNVEAF